MRTSYSVFHFPLRFASIFFWFIAAFLLSGTPVAAMAADAITPQIIQGYIAHADPAKALKDLAPILKSDPHSAKAWYLQAEALDALGRDVDAKTALSTAEHLSPAMSFANPKDLQELEKRVGLQNVQSSRESSSRMKVFLGILLVVLLMGTGAFLFMRNERRKAAALVESDRQDILLEMTQFLTGELNSAKISADAQGDTKKLSDIHEWHASLVDAAQALKNVENDDTDSKKTTVANARYLLKDIRDKLSGKPSVTEAEINPFYDPEAVKISGNVQTSPFPPSSSYASAEPSQPAVYPVNNMGGNMGMNTGGGLGAALEEGLGMGLGMEIAEDLLGGGMDLFGNNGGDSFGSGDFGSSGMDGDGFGGGTDDGLGLGGGDNFGGTDDGFSGGDSFGGGADDGFSSDDSSW